MIRVYQMADCMRLPVAFFGENLWLFFSSFFKRANKNASPRRNPDPRWTRPAGVVGALVPIACHNSHTSAPTTRSENTSLLIPLFLRAQILPGIVLFVYSLMHQPCYLRPRDPEHKLLDNFLLHPIVQLHARNPNIDSRTAASHKRTRMPLAARTAGCSASRIR